MLFKSILASHIEEKKNQICVGVDPHFEILPPLFKRYAEEKGLPSLAKKWGLCLVHLAKEFSPALKFQSSFFESLGPEGFLVLKELMKEASSCGVFSILDVKRCDIASTMKAYGDSAFSEFKADAMTVIPYMGLDVFRALYPWMERGKGVYSVFLSSNPTGFQKLSSFVREEATVAEHFHQDLFRELEEKGLSDALGLVVGVKSYDQCYKRLNPIKEKFSLLLPGLGFQGGGIGDSTKGLLGSQKNHLFPVSRSLSGLGNPNLLSEMNNLENFSSYEDFLFQRMEELLQDMKP